MKQDTNKLIVTEDEYCTWDQISLRKNKETLMQNRNKLRYEFLYKKQGLSKTKKIHKKS